ncbi:MAG: L-fucose/L-arabinose isomerase family protein [Planctomycetota bacterium]
MTLPKIGLLGLMQELYDAFMPGITERQEAYAREVAETLSGVADVVFPRAAKNRADVEQIMADFHRDGCDGIIIVNLVYGPGINLVRALRECRLPLLLANIQPTPRVTADWTMNELTWNQGVHGMQDTGNAVMRAGIRAAVVTDDFRAPGFIEEVGAWAAAAHTARAMASMRIAGIGQMPGMGDILSDPQQVLRVLGPQVDQVAVGRVVAAMETVSDAAVDAIMADNARHFDIDPKLRESEHRYAARMQAALQQVLEEGDYHGFSFYFNAPSEDGRLRMLPLMAASNLMAAGYGYAAEGDTNCATLVSAGHLLAPDANFTEMYAMDFERDTALMSHMGEGNWRIARKDRKPTLVDRPLGIGGLDNPPTVVFQGQPGPATLTNLVATNDGNFRLLCASGEIIDSEDMPAVEMPYFHFRPKNGIRSCCSDWLRAGGSHHQCIHLGDHTTAWRYLAEILGLEFVTL